MPFVAIKKPCRIFTSCKASLYSFSREFIISTAGLLFAPWAAGMGFPAGSPYAVGVKEPTENQRNGIVEIFVFKTVGLNVRLQRRRGVPQARPSRPPGGFS
jgi:hypothetical protein